MLPQTDRALAFTSGWLKYKAVHGTTQVASAVIKNGVLFAIERAVHVHTVVNVAVYLPVETKHQGRAGLFFENNGPAQITDLLQRFQRANGDKFVGLHQHYAQAACKFSSQADKRAGVSSFWLS